MKNFKTILSIIIRIIGMLILSSFFTFWIVSVGHYSRETANNSFNAVVISSSGVVLVLLLKAIFTPAFLITYLLMIPYIILLACTGVFITELLDAYIVGIMISFPYFFYIRKNEMNSEAVSNQEEIIKSNLMNIREEADITSPKRRIRMLWMLCSFITLLAGGLVFYLLRSHDEDHAIEWNYPTEASSVLISPSAEFIAQCSKDKKSVILTHTGINKKLESIEHEQDASSIVFSHDSGYLATGSCDGNKKEIPLDSLNPSLGKKKWSYPHDSMWVWIARHGDYIALSSKGLNSLSLYRRSTGEKLVTIGHGGDVLYVSFSSDGRYIATASSDHSAKLYDIAKRKQIASIEHEDEVVQVEFSSNSRYLATASYDNNAKLYDITQEVQVDSIVHESNIWHVAFSPSGRYLATASYDNSAKLYDIKQKRQVGTIGHKSAVWYVAFSPDEHYLATASDDDSAKLYDIIQKKEVTTIPHDGTVSYVTFSPDGRFLATASWKGAKLYSINQKENIAYIGQGSRIHHVTFSPDGRVMATASWQATDNSTKLYDITERMEIATIEHDHWIINVEFSPDGRYLATASTDRSVTLYDMRQRRQINTTHYDCHVGDIYFTADSKQLLRATGKELLVTPLD